MSDRKCTNCAHCERFESVYGFEKIRCWYEPEVCDHAFVISVDDAQNHVCEEHVFQKEWDAKLFNDAKGEYARLKEQIRRLEEKYPQLKHSNI